MMTRDATEFESKFECCPIQTIFFENLKSDGFSDSFRFRFCFGKPKVV